MPTRRQKRRERVRQQLANRPLTKVQQIQKALDYIESLPIDPLTGTVIFPEDPSEHHPN